MYKLYTCLYCGQEGLTERGLHRHTCRGPLKEKVLMRNPIKPAKLTDDQIKRCLEYVPPTQIELFQ